MKIIKKLCIFLLAFSLVLPIFSNIKVKADTSFSLENMSEDEIVDLIFNSCKCIYPKEGQTTEEWATYLNKKIPFLNETQINDFKTFRWNNDRGKDFIIDYYYSYKINHINEFYIYYGNYSEAMDGSYHLSKDDNNPKYIYISFYIDDNYNKANKLYDLLVNRLEKYYGKGTNNKDITKNKWTWGIDYTNIKYYNYKNGIFTLLSLQKNTNYYSFELSLYNANDLANPTDYAKSFLDDSDEFSLSDDEDEFSFDDEIDLDDPVIKSITNKKGKKLVVKYSGDDSFDNEIYKIQISTNKNFKSSKEFETKKTSATISKLKKGKTYYVRIMYTVTEDGETVSSNWSKTKSIKIKK